MIDHDDTCGGGCAVVCVGSVGVGVVAVVVFL